MKLQMPKIEKACPECNRPLVVRRQRASGSLFLGCSGWPEHCQHTEAIPESVRMQLSGAPRLEGF